MPSRVFTAGIRAAIALGICISVAIPSGAGSNGETIYRLTEAAYSWEGCILPCVCWTWYRGDVRGTFVLGPPTTGDGVITHEVLNVNWIVTIHDDEWEFTGSGTYQISNGPEPRVHSLDLTLSWDGWITEFSSGFVPLSSNNGSIDIPIEPIGQECYGFGIVVRASPLSDDSLLHFRLAADSTYQQGCFEPCFCPLQEPRELHGNLSLVPVLEEGTYVEYSVAQADLVALPLNEGGNEVSRGINMTGFGMYTLAQGFAGPAHHLELELQANGGAAEHFSSEFANTDPTFPESFDIVVDINDQVCFDTVLSIHATGSGPIVFRDDFECGDLSAWSGQTVQ